MAGTSFVNVVGYWGGAHKADGFDVGVLQQGVYRHFVALHHIEDPVRQPSLLEQIGHQQSGRRVGGAGFEHKGIARGNRHRKHPHRHHDRKVKRRDARHHAQRLAQRPVVHAGGHLFGEVGFEQLGNAGGKFHNFNATGHFALGIGKHLAVLGGNQVRQRIAVLVEQLQKFKQNSRALEGRGVCPSWKCRVGGGYRALHLFGAGQRCAAGHGAGGRVGYILIAARSTGYHMACQKVVNSAHGEVSCWGSPVGGEHLFSIGADHKRPRLARVLHGLCIPLTFEG